MDKLNLTVRNFGFYYEVFTSSPPPSTSLSDIQGNFTEPIYLYTYIEQSVMIPCTLFGNKCKLFFVYKLASYARH